MPEIDLRKLRLQSSNVSSKLGQDKAAVKRENDSEKTFLAAALK